MKSTRYDTRSLALLALLTAIVAVLQMMGIAIRFGTFAVSMVGVPVIIGGALLGPGAGAWLGLVFGITVLASGDAALFFAWDPIATVAIVLLKGTLAGLAAGAFYRLLEKKSGFGAALAAAVTYPLVNTGVFFLGSMLFFMDDCIQFAANLGIPGSGPVVIAVVFIGFNIFFELGLDLVLCPVIVRIINARRPFAAPIQSVKDKEKE